MKIINQNSNYNQNNTQFKSLKFLNKNKISRTLTVEISANILHQNSKDLFKLTKKASQNQLLFLKKLTDNYNGKYFSEQNPLLIESSTLVNKIYEHIKNPTQKAQELASSFKGKLETLDRIFINIDNNKKKLNFANKVHKDIILKRHNSRPELIAELLESKNSKLYIKNYNQYKPYLELNSVNKNTVTDLDNMVENNTYNAKFYKDKVLYENRKKQFPIIDTENFNADIYAQEYSPEKNSMLDSIITNMYLSRESLKMGSDIELRKIYSSTTKDNVKTRVAILNKYPCTHKNDMKPEKTLNHLIELNTLFSTIDNDKLAHKFVKYSLINKINGLFKIQDLNRVLKERPSAQLYTFRKNASNIISQTSGDEQIQKLKDEITNPFFETKSTIKQRKKMEKYAYIKPLNFINKFLIKISNQFLIMKYNFLYPEAIKTAPKSAISIPQKAVESEIKSNVIAVVSPKSETMTEKTIQDSEKQNVIETIKNKTNKTILGLLENLSINAQTIAKTKAKNKKLEVKHKTLEYASSKLGKKTFEKQEKLFELKATQMRLNLLPEIFNSIQDTRKIDKLIGQKHINSSNKDALELFILINGSNKKLVNYMLKKRNTDNSRMFEVKDIINTLKNAEAKIAKEKQSNSNYRANDAKKYYNHLYEAKIEQYGKLQHTHKLNISQ